MMFQIVPLIGTMSPMWSYVLNYVLCLCFIATVPCIIRKVVRG